MNHAFRLTTTAVLAVLLVVATATAAVADAAGPTNYRAEVAAVGGSGFSAEVYGGDSFLVLTVEPGREVLVQGYEDDPDAAPYLRFDAAGDVFVNRRSPAAYLNDARYGGRDVTPPPDADPLAPPVWEQVASGGTYAWHDHRIHWMSPSVPSQVDQDAGTTQPVLEWEVPIVVDGEPVAIGGSLVWEPSRSPVVPLAVALAFLVGVALAVHRRRTASLPVVAGASAVALALGLAELTAAPPGAEADPLGVVLPAVGLASAAAAVALRGRGERTTVGLTVLGTVPLLVWAALRIGTFTAPVLVGAAPEVLARYGVAVVLGASLGVLVAGGLSLIEPLEDVAAA